MLTVLTQPEVVAGLGSGVTAIFLGLTMMMRQRRLARHDEMKFELLNKIFDESRDMKVLEYIPNDRSFEPAAEVTPPALPAALSRSGWRGARGGHSVWRA